MKSRSLLVINTLPENDPAVQAAIGALTSKAETGKVIHTEDMKILPCIGCNACWLKPPGVCAIRDDYENILRALLRYDAAILIAGTALGFIDHRAKKHRGSHPSPDHHVYPCGGRADAPCSPV